MRKRHDAPLLGRCSVASRPPGVPGHRLHYSLRYLIRPIRLCSTTVV